MPVALVFESFIASLSLWSNMTAQMFTRQSKGLLKSAGQQTVSTEVSVHAHTNCVHGHFP